MFDVFSDSYELMKNIRVVKQSAYNRKGDILVAYIGNIDRRFLYELLPGFIK